MKNDRKHILNPLTAEFLEGIKKKRMTQDKPLF